MQRDHYYYQELAKISQWEPPQWSYCRGLVEGLRTHFAQQVATSKQQTTSATAAPARESSGRCSVSKERCTEGGGDTRRHSAAKLKEADEWEEQRELLSSQVGVD